MSVVHPEYAQRGSFEHLRLGRNPRKPDPRDLVLANYLDYDLVLPKVPASADWGKAVSKWPMYGNDTLGDCTCAAAGHMIQAWSANHSKLHTPTLHSVEALYWATGSQDDGRMETDVLNYWRHTGLAGDKITAYVKVNPQNLAHVRAATWLFGGVYLGVALPVTAQRQQVWDVVTTHGQGAPGSWGGHAVPVVAYGNAKLTCVTWGSTLQMTSRFFTEYVDECYAIISHDWVTSAKAAPSGFNLAALQADLAAL